MGDGPPGVAWLLVEVMIGWADACGETSNSTASRTAMMGQVAKTRMVGSRVGGVDDKGRRMAGCRRDGLRVRSGQWQTRSTRVLYTDGDRDGLPRER